MWPFKPKPCEHPFYALMVERRQTVEREDPDFDAITYHLYCRICHTSLQLKHARLVGGVDGFFERSRQREIRDTRNAVSNEETP